MSPEPAAAAEPVALVVRVPGAKGRGAKGKSRGRRQRVRA